MTEVDRFFGNDEDDLWKSSAFKRQVLKFCLATFANANANMCDADDALRCDISLFTVEILVIEEIHFTSRKLKPKMKTMLRVDYFQSVRDTRVVMLMD